MKKILLATSLIGLMLMSSGCNEDSDAVDTLENQELLDNQDYAGVIEKLGDINETILTASENMALGAAYMGRSGVGLSDIIEIMLDSTNADDNASADDGFAKFADSIDAKKSDTALSDLKSSTRYYENIVGASCEGNTTNLSTSTQDICLNIGLASSVQAVVTIGYLGDVGSLLAGFDSTSTENGDQMDASTCAMQYAIDDNKTKQTNLGCIAAPGSDVTFANQKTYTPLTITMSDTNNTYDYLLTAPIAGTSARSTAITNGYCTEINFDTRDEAMTYDTKTTGFYICPVGEDPDAEELTTESMIVDALNGGFDSIIAASGADSDIATSIEEMKLEINKDSNGSEDTEITMEDIIAYLNGTN